MLLQPGLGGWPWVSGGDPHLGWARPSPVGYQPVVPELGEQSRVGGRSH